MTLAAKLAARPILAHTHILSQAECLRARMLARLGYSAERIAELLFDPRMGPIAPWKVDAIRAVKGMS